MNMKNLRKAKIILAVYLIATMALLLLGYSVRKPKVAQQEFPFTITYFYDGKEETISGVFVVEFAPSAQYMGDNSIGWFGYVAGALLMTYIAFALPMWFDKPNPVVLVPCNFAALTLYLFYINFATCGDWFLTFAYGVGRICVAC